MSDYRNMYFRLAGKLANVIEELDKFLEDLKEAQREEEEACIEDIEISDEE